MRLMTMLGTGVGTLAGTVLGRRVPLNVILSVTGRCTGRCSYCAIPDRDTQELTLDEIRRLIDDAAGMGCRRLGIWGGEPLIREDIGDIIGHAKRRGLFVTLDTNGHLLPGRLHELKGLDHLLISLDGPREMHDANRGRGSFDRTMAGMEAAAEAVPFWTITVLTRHNLDGIGFVLDTARRFGSMATFQVLHHNELLGKGHDDHRPPDGEYREAVRRLLRARGRGAPVASSRRYLRHLLAWPDFGTPALPHVDGAPTCRAGKFYCNVDTDGSLYPCSLLTGKNGAPPNIRERGFRDAFARLEKQAPCGACSAACYTEYNYLYSLDPLTIADWIGAMKRTRKPT